MSVLTPARNKLVLRLQTLVEHVINEGAAWFREASAVEQLQNTARALTAGKEEVSQDDQALLWEIVCDLWVRRSAANNLR